MSEALLGMDSMSMTTLIAVGAGIVIVLGLIYWAFRRRGKSPFVRASASRQPRLAVLDAAQVDDRRRLILVRRDHVEHLVMIGGPSDIVVERGINRTSMRPAQEPVSAPATVTQAGAQPAAPRSPQRVEPPPRPQPVAVEPALAKPESVTIPANDASQAAAIAGSTIAASMATAEEPPVPVPDPVPVPEPVKTPERTEEQVSENPPPDKGQPSAPAASAASVSSAAVSAADPTAKIESASQDVEPSKPQELPDELEPAPNVELEASVAELANTPAPDEVAAVELEDIFDATNKAPSTVPESRPEPAVDVPPPADESAERQPNLSDVSEALEDVATDGTEETVMSAEELIADFDDLLEAEISRAKEQQPEVPIPATDADNVTPLQKQSLEDEMKKLLGDLNVKP